MSARMREQCRSDARYYTLFQNAPERMKRRKASPEALKARSSKKSEKPTPKATGCGGCTKRKEAMNKIIPKSGDAVEWVTDKTGLKGWWENRPNKNKTDQG